MLNNGRTFVVIVVQRKLGFGGERAQEAGERARGNRGTNLRVYRVYSARYIKIQHILST